MRLSTRIVAGIVSFALVVGAGIVAPGHTSASPSSDPGSDARLMVQFHDAVPPEVQSVALGFSGVGGGDVLGRLPQIDLALVRASGATRNRLRANPLIERVDADTLVRLATTPNDPEVPGLVGLDDISVEAAWDTYPGPGNFGNLDGAPIAIIDSGIDPTHEEFQGAGKIPVCETYPANPLYNPVDCTNGAGDDIAHGTHVAGIAAANADNAKGIAGVSPTSPLQVYKACQGEICWLFDVMNGVIDATDNGAQVINLSLGGPVPLPQWSDAIGYALRNDVVIAAAAGNGGSVAYHYPASFNGVLSTAALSTGTGVKASFSQVNNQVDIAGPGTGILSSVAPEANGGVPNSYLSYSGTSMATPHVVGVAALVRSAHPGWSAGKVRGALLNTATDVEAPGIDNKTGYGRVNADAAIDYSPVDDDDDDNDGTPDLWDADPDDPTRWSVSTLSGSVARDATRVSASWLDFLGVVRIGIVTVKWSGNTLFSLVSPYAVRGTSVTGATLTGSGFAFGPDGFGTRTYKIKLFDDSTGDQGGDSLTVQVGATLLTDGVATAGNLTIRGT